MGCGFLGRVGCRNDEGGRRRVGRGVKETRGRMRRWGLNRHGGIKGVGNWNGNKRMHGIALGIISWGDF